MNEKFVNEFIKKHPGIDPEFCMQHFERLDDEYFSAFNEDQIYRHITIFQELDNKKTFDLIIDGYSENINITILSYNYSSVFSLLTGVLSSLDFSIISGNVFTYRKSDIERKLPGGAYKRRKFSKKELIFKKRRIVDRFSGEIKYRGSLEEWRIKLEKRLAVIFSYLEKSESDSIDKARRKVNNWVAGCLSEKPVDVKAVFYPMNIKIDNDGPLTKIYFIGHDTPYFLYALSNALAINNVSIERIIIKTMNKKVEDEFYCTGSAGDKITDKRIIDNIKISILLTKQFTYFIGSSPDPYYALIRFENLIHMIWKNALSDKLSDLLTNPKVLEGLAKLLGTSEYLWEDFIRLQYENLLPMLKPEQKKRKYSVPLEILEKKLNTALKGSKSTEEKKRILNEWKDREIFLLDLDHILIPEYNFKDLSEGLTRLAEVIVKKSFEIGFDILSEIYGKPKTIAGIDVPYTILGLGKFGGGALGYASDIEIIFVYSDNGYTDGVSKIENSEFFNKLVRESAGIMEAKREGIFHVDLRLRPYGSAGPMACSLERFCSYYGKNGSAHSYEKLALVRLRAIYKNELSEKIERLRDEFIYESTSIDIKSLMGLREKQMAHKTDRNRLNAKFSPGALVDIEYTVQILQIIHNRKSPGLRTPKIHIALNELAKAGVLSGKEAEPIIGAYYFLRRLINGLRMLRGSALDLALPPVDSDEYNHLARRMGYVTKFGIFASQRLHIEFESQTALVRSFADKFFGDFERLKKGVGNIADILLMPDISLETSTKILCRTGLKNIKRAVLNFKKLSELTEKKTEFINLAVLATDLFKQLSDPDMALNNWERYMMSIDNPEEIYDLLIYQPIRLEMLLKIFSGSQFLSDTLIKYPEFFVPISRPDTLYIEKSLKEYLSELNDISIKNKNDDEWKAQLRIYKKREILRIGTKDICFKSQLAEVMSEISYLAMACIQVSLDRRLKKSNFNSTFCVFAFGKLGGNELNYSSDIDLLGVYENGSEKCIQKKYWGIMEKVSEDLSSHTEDGFCYRVDLRLRPYGSSGELVYPLNSILKYYKEDASLWELQAALKLGIVAGNEKTGKKLLSGIKKILVGGLDEKKIISIIMENRFKAIKKNEGKRIAGKINIKEGRGGIRDIEFFIQAYQLINLNKYPDLLEANTLKAIKLLFNYNLISSEVAESLRRNYIFFRRVEHFLQLYENQQIHTIPEDGERVLSLSKRVHSSDVDTKTFISDIKKRLLEIENIFLSLEILVNDDK